MKRTVTIFLTTLLVALFVTTGAIAQESGDFRSAADGDWSATATWETYDGTNWVGADAAPDGSENITIQNGDTVNVASGNIEISGRVTVEGTVEPPFTGGVLTADGGTLVFADGSTYQHDRNEGDVPIATWNSGSTITLTGIVTNDPGNLDQDFFNFTWNNTAQLENINIGWNDYTLEGNLTVLNTNGQQFRLSSAGDEGDPARSITINGNVVVDGESSEFTATGSGDIFDYNVEVMGDVAVTNGGYLAVSRGSGGRAVWTVHGDMTVDNGKVGESDIEKHGQRRSFVFAGSEAQTITGNDVGTSSTLYYEIAAGSDVTVAGTYPMDSLTVAGNLTLSGELEADGPVVLDGAGTMTVADGGTYTHAHDAGDVPVATWESGSTINLTGIVTNDPDNLDQDFYNFTWNNADQIENINIGWNDYTLEGNLTVLNTNGQQFRLSSAGDEGDPARSITINGNVVVDGESSEFTATGSGDIFDYNVEVMGDVVVTNGAYLSVSRGSGGRAVWTLHGDLTVNDSRLGESDIDKHGQQRSFVFAGAEAQIITADSVETESTLFYEINSGSNVTIAGNSSFPIDSLTVNGDLTIEGELVANGEIAVAEGGSVSVAGSGTYNHAYDGGSIPTATWAEGSDLLVSGTVTSAPDNGNQDFYNIVINAPGNIENNDLGMRNNTINGNIDVLNTGTARFYLSNPDSFDSLSIDIMGDIYMAAEAEAFASNGTGSGATQIEIHHYGDITVDGGNFSISRGSGPIVNWYMYEGSITFNAGETQNSNARAGSAFIFAGEDTVQHLAVSEEVDISHLPIRVNSGAYLDMGTTNLSESGDNFTLEAGGTLASASAEAFSTADGGNLELGGSGSTQLTLSNEAHYVINGSEAQVTGFALPLQVASLTIDNEAGVTQSRGLTINEFLLLKAGVFDNTIGFTLGTGAEIIYEGGSLTIPVSNENEGEGIPDKFALNQNYPNPFNPTTTISYDVPEAADVTLTVYDITGREVAQLVNSRQSAGVYEVDWNAQNLATGVYIYRIQAGNFTAVRKLTLIK